MNMKDKKKLCIAINGAMRITTEAIIDCIENYKKQFSWANPDLWLFTWKTEDLREEALRPHVYKLIAAEPSPTNDYLDKLGIPYTMQLVKQPEHKVCRISHFAQIYGLNYLFNKIAQSGEEYEFACRARNDLYFEADTYMWEWLVKDEPKAYLSPGILWGDMPGSNDHLGFGKFDIVKKIWSYNPDDFKKTLSESWNIEVYIQKMIEKNAVHKIVDVNRYLLRRTGRTDLGNADWIMK